MTDSAAEVGISSNSRPSIPPPRSSNPGSDSSKTSAAARLSASRSPEYDSSTSAIVGHLRQLAQSDNLESFRGIARQGLGSDEARQIAWPILLGKSTTDYKQDWRTLPPHRDEDQVKLDVDRSFIYYPPNQSAKGLAIRKIELSNLITEVLRRNSFLCYFQGYHDICQVFLLVLGPVAAVPAVTRLSLFRIRDFMLPSMNPSLYHLRLLPELVSAEDARLAGHLSLTQPFFALAATITLYAHEIQEYGDIARLFDAFLSRDTVFPVYLFAQIVLSRKPELLDIPSDEPEMLYSILSKLPKPLDLDVLLEQTDKLLIRRPPNTLKGWRSISKASALKTTLDGLNIAPLSEGEASFRKLVAETQRAEKLNNLRISLLQYQRPARSVGLAVAVVVLSWYLRRQGYMAWVIGRGSVLHTIMQRLRLY